jgi:hypothetical protein
MSKIGGKSPPRPAPAAVRSGMAGPRPGHQPREVFGRFFETLGQLDANGRGGRGGAR